MKEEFGSFLKPKNVAVHRRISHRRPSRHDVIRNILANEYGEIYLVTRREGDSGAFGVAASEISPMESSWRSLSSLRKTHLSPARLRGEGYPALPSSRPALCRGRPGGADPGGLVEIIREKKTPGHRAEHIGSTPRPIHLRPPSSPSESPRGKVSYIARRGNFAPTP